MSLIVDASVALKWYLAEEPDAAAAQAILQMSEPLTAPDIVVAETCNAAWRGVQVGRMQPRQALDIARSLPALFDILASSAALAERAVSIAVTLDHPVYDCLYLALAETTQTCLVTADGRLLTRVNGTPWQILTQPLTAYARSS